MRALSGIRAYSNAEATAKHRFMPDLGEYPEGFKVTGVHCGQKKASNLLDLALIVSDRPCSAAAVFTQNAYKAAPVIVSREILQQRHGSGVRAIVTNSGCANAVTGSQGLKDAWRMSKAVDGVIGEVGEKSTSLVMSTGVIGQRLAIDKIIEGIPMAVQQLGSSHSHWHACAKAFCTTDTFPKFGSSSIFLPTSPSSQASQPFRIAGIAKGAGMIHPNMATLLGVMATDAAVSPEALQSALTYAVERSFNSISIDGDTSTNDTVAILANGTDTPPIQIDGPGWIEFRTAVTDFAEHLAKLVVRDGEGATKFVTVHVKDANSYADAKQVASTIARSSLVKTALYGEDANWGRILCATGYSGVPLEPSRTNVSFVPTDNSPVLKLLVDGEPEVVDEARASEILAMEDLEIEVSLGSAAGHDARFYTCGKYPLVYTSKLSNLIFRRFQS